MRIDEHTYTHIAALLIEYNVNAMNVFYKKYLLEQNEEDERNHCSAKPNINCILYIIPQCV